MLDHLIGRGLKEEPPSVQEIGRFRAKILLKLADAQIDTISLDSRFDLCYEALLQIGLLALRANGLRPDSRGGHHVLALQSLPTTIGFPQGNVRLLDEFRRRRAAALYDGSFAPSQSELDSLLRTTRQLWEPFP